MLSFFSNFDEQYNVTSENLAKTNENLAETNSCKGFFFSLSWVNDPFLTWTTLSINQSNFCTFLHAELFQFCDNGGLPAYSWSVNWFEICTNGFMCIEIIHFKYVSKSLSSLINFNNLPSGDLKQFLAWWHQVLQSLRPN